MGKPAHFAESQNRRTRIDELDFLGADGLPVSPAAFTLFGDLKARNTRSDIRRQISDINRIVVLVEHLADVDRGQLFQASEKTLELGLIGHRCRHAREFPGPRRIQVLRKLLQELSWLLREGLFGCHLGLSFLLMPSRDMCQLIAPAVLHQQMPTDQIRQTRAMLEAIVAGYRATRFKFDTGEEFTDLRKRGASYCSARLIRRATTSYKAINSDEQSLPFSRRKISAGCSLSWTLM